MSFVKIGRVSHTLLNGINAFISVLIFLDWFGLNFVYEIST
jgi:hypothetical protein